MEHTILEGAKCDDWYEAASQGSVRGLSVLGFALLWFVVAQAGLFLALGHSWSFLAGDLVTVAPSAVQSQTPPPPDAASPVDTDGNDGAETAESTLLRSRGGLDRLREYLGRTVGVIPAVCSATEPEAALRKPSGSGPDPTAAPSLVNLAHWLPSILGGEAKPAPSLCEWRDLPVKSLAGFISPDVGPVQKVTLFLLFVGLGVLRRHGLRRELEGMCFPSRKDTSGRAGDVVAKGDPRTLEHPVNRDGTSYIRPNALLYPFGKLPLDRDNRILIDYEQDLHHTRSRLSKTNHVAPVDMTILVLEAGLANGQPGAASDRIESVVLDYRERLLGGLSWAEYLLWLLPTIGFLGTIYGISASLVRAKGLFGGGSVEADLESFAENIGTVVDGLGVAFDTTSMALICSAFLYFHLKRAEAGIADLLTRCEHTLTDLLIKCMLPADADDVSPWTYGNGEPEAASDARSEDPAE